MAIYSLNLGFVSRSEGRSSVGFAAYISGSKAYDQRTGAAYNYSNKKEVIRSGILAPEGAPDWAKNPHTFWNKVEAAEEKFASSWFKNEEAKEKFLASAQTAQTVMGAIPIELTEDQAEACVIEFLMKRFVSRGLVLQYGLHWDRGNPHFHAQITRRCLVEDELSHRKDRDIVSKAELKETRKAWEVFVNKHLTLAGHEVRIDCRSKADQGSLFMATYHEGWYAQHLAEQGKHSRIVADNEQIRQHNIEIMYEKPEALIYELALKRTTVTRKHIEEEIIRRVGGDEKLFAILKARVDGIEIPSELVLQQSNENIVYESFTTDVQKVAVKLTDTLLANKDVAHRVGENLDHDIIYTSSQYKQQEQTVSQYADTLDQVETKVIKSEKINQAIQSLEQRVSEERGEAFQFFPEQSSAIHHLCTGSDIRVLNGKAGTGKTTLLKAVAETYAQEGYRVLGTSFQGKAVEIMEQEIGIPCKTLHSLTHAWDSYDQKKDLVDSGKLWGRPLYYAIQQMKELEQHRFTDKDVIIVDEANMIGGSLWEPFLKEASSQGAKVLIVQDPAQIKCRDPGDYGRLFAEKYGACETSTVVRQKIAWQRECSEILNDHHVLDGLMPYYEKGHIQWFETNVEVRERLVQDYLQDLKADPDQTRMILAYRNSEVYDLNQDIRQALIAEGSLKEHFKFDGREYSVGDQILFAENDNHGRYVKNEIKTPQDITLPKGIKNGSFGTIIGYDTKHESLKVRLHKDNRIVHFTAAEYPHITLGYAMSIHKSEGSTFDQTFVSPDALMDPTTTLVSITRHRHGIQMYVNREQFIDFKHLVDQLSYGGLRETLQDYQVSEEQRPYLERVQQYKDLFFEANILREEVESILKPDEAFHEHSSYESYQLCFDQKKEIAGEILNDWENHLPYLRLAGLRKDVLEVEVGQRPRLLSDLEYRASIQVQGYIDLVQQTRSLWKTIAVTHPGNLSQSHELYSEYKSLKTERDSLAAVFHENPRLYKQFFSYTKETDSESYKDVWRQEVAREDRVYFSALKQHAQAHHKNQLQNLYYQKLGFDEKGHYNLVESYLTARNQAATIFCHLKKLEDSSVQTSSNILLSQETFKEIQAERDQLALKIIESPTKCQAHLEYFAIKEDKLLEHAIAGEARVLINAYQENPDLEIRAEYAKQLKSHLKDTKSSQLMKEAGIDFNRLTFDIAFYKGIISGDISPDAQPDQVYKPIKNYLDKSHEAALLWNIVQAKSKEENLQTKPIEVMNYSPLKAEWQQALQARNENAIVLLQNKVASLVLMEMKPGIESRLITLAEKTISRQEQLMPVPILPTHTTLHKNTRQTYIPAEKVIEAAKGKYSDIVTKLMGNPNQRMSSRSTLRFGKLGEVVFSTAGSKEGLWHDFSTGEGGNIFHLIQREKNLDFRGSVEYLARELNVNLSEQIHHQDLKREVIDPPIAEAIEAKDIAQRLSAVLDLQAKSEPIQGTIAEQYLRQERGIQGELPNDLRYLPKSTTFTYKGEQKIIKHDCFAAFGRDQEGNISVAQITKLNPDGTRALTKSGEKLNKLQYGVSKGAFVTLQEGTDRVFIAEGLETALSIKEAGVIGKIVASLGVNNMTNYTGSEEKIILCADNDDINPKSRTHEMVTKAYNHLKDQGHTVEIIKPAIPGQDFNDVLKDQGVKAVTQYVRVYTDNSICKQVRYFEGIFKQIQNTSNPQEKDKLIDMIEDKIILLSLGKDYSFIDDIKAVNLTVGNTLEELQARFQELHRQQEIQRSASKALMQSFA